MTMHKNKTAPGAPGPAQSTVESQENVMEPPPSQPLTVTRGGIGAWLHAWWVWTAQRMWPARRIPWDRIDKIIDLRVGKVEADLERYRPLNTLVTQFHERMRGVVSEQRQLLKGQSELHSEIMALRQEQAEPSAELIAAVEAQATVMQGYLDMHATLKELIDTSEQCLRVAQFGDTARAMSSIARNDLAEALIGVYGPLWQCDALPCRIIYTGCDDEQAVRGDAEALGIPWAELRAQLPCDSVALVEIPELPHRAGSQCVVLMYAAPLLGPAQVRQVVERCQWLVKRLRNTPAPRPVLPCVMSPHFTDFALEQVQKDRVLALGRAGSTWPVPVLGEPDSDHPALRATAHWVDVPTRV